MTLNFRKAKRKDLDRIVEMLSDDFLGTQREKFQTPMPESYVRAFEEIDADKNNELIVVEFNDEIVGTLQLTFIPNITFQGGKRIQIEGVRIDKRFRGMGIGKKLFEWAIERAKERNCKIVQLTTNADRKDALHFYEQLDFTASHIGMKLYLK